MHHRRRRHAGQCAECAAFGSLESLCEAVRDACACSAEALLALWAPGMTGKCMRLDIQSSVPQGQVIMHHKMGLDLSDSGCAGEVADACFMSLLALMDARHGPTLHLAAQAFKPLGAVLLAPGGKGSAAQRAAAQKLTSKATSFVEQAIRCFIRRSQLPACWLLEQFCIRTYSTARSHARDMRPTACTVMH